ncbi:hypothetical protein [Mycolicibacterium sp.]|uniref:hypothetical protein n=2 Tax=Mycolicibacterium sp. TaxID=2320850 RepID=UPI00093B9A79|nr:hypothetical protein EB73_16685 [Mycobacterium sp. SWH-M3]
MNVDRNELRALVREVVREAVSGLRPAAPQTPETAVGSSAPPTVAATAPPAPATSIADQMGLTPTGPLAANEKSRVETVRLGSDADLDGFVRKLLRLFENPKNRADLKAGRLSFRLAGGAGPRGAGAIHRIDSGAVTERHIADMAGGTLVLGRRAVLTPLAREKARALGITIQKERR